MLAASAEGVDLARLLLDLLIVLAVAKLAAEVAERFRLPAVLGEITAGILIGPSVLDWVHLSGERGVSMAMIAEIGVLLLLLQVGMEMDLAELGKVGKASMLVAIIGVALPFAGGAISGIALGEEVKTSIFLGAALTATSVGITARVFGDLRALATTEARIVLGAAVADDVLGLVILTVVVKVVTGGTVGFGTVAGTLGLAVGFLLATGIVGLLVVPKLLNALHRHVSSGATLVVAGLVLTLAFAELADAAKLAFIIGAFMAGLALRKSDHHERIAHDLGAIGNVFIPVFFVQIGINADLEAMTKPSVLGLAAVLTVVGIVGKLAAAAGAVGTRSDKLLVGLGMIPRGEVGLIFASIGLTNGVLDGDLYGALLVVVLVTTLCTPPLLRWRLGQAGAVDATVGAFEPPEPDGGWLEVAGGQIHLRGTPPVSATVPLALGVASLLKQHRPGDDLLDWFGTHRNDPLAWKADDTAALVDLLRSGDVRAWRFLDVTGVLERALPELAAAMRRRRADISDLDPVGALRFPTMDALQRLAPDGTAHGDELVIAALAADVCEDATTNTECVTDLVTRLGRDNEAERIADLVSDAHLLRSAVSGLSVFDETELLQLATHLASPVHARNAYTLALALGDLPTWHREALDELHRLVQEALDHPELTGSDATNLAAARRQAAQRLAATPAAADRLRCASTGYLLTHQPEELARQARLVEPLARPGNVRVAVSPLPTPDHWEIDVACRDRDGLLAHLADVIMEFGLDIVSASVATWADGAVLDSFIVRTTSRPSARELALAMERSLRRPLSLEPVNDVDLQFDNDALPWHTLCVVRGPDRPGVLQAVTVAFAKAGAVVHSARIRTSGDQISDRFTVSDRVGRKLDEEAMARVRRALAGARVRRSLLTR